MTEITEQLRDRARQDRIAMLRRLIDADGADRGGGRGSLRDRAGGRACSTAIYGGQSLAEALMAAARTVEPERRINSAHCYFLRLGDPARPITYGVDRLRDTRILLGAAGARRAGRAGDHHRDLLLCRAGDGHRASMADARGARAGDIAAARCRTDRAAWRRPAQECRRALADRPAPCRSAALGPGHRRWPPPRLDARRRAAAATIHCSTPACCSMRAT